MGSLQGVMGTWETYKVW